MCIFKNYKLHFLTIYTNSKNIRSQKSWNNDRSIFVSIFLLSLIVLRYSSVHKWRGWDKNWSTLKDLVQSYLQYQHSNTKPRDCFLEIVVNKEFSDTRAEGCSCKHYCKREPTNEECWDDNPNHYCDPTMTCFKFKGETFNNKNCLRWIAASFLSCFLAKVITSTLLSGYRDSVLCLEQPSEASSSISVMETASWGLELGTFVRDLLIWW